jgi:hypothetical protein
LTNDLATVLPHDPVGAVTGVLSSRVERREDLTELADRFRDSQLRLLVERHWVILSGPRRALPRRLGRMRPLPVFDCGALFDALDSQRRDHGLGWYELADQLWEQSSDLNVQRGGDHPLCGGAVQRLQERQATSCQYALFMLRWLHRAPEDFLVGEVVDVGDVALPEAGTDSRLRWDLNLLHTALNEQRKKHGLTWAQLAEELGCTPSRLTNLRTARLADMALAMRVTQWLGQPAAAFIHPAQW